MGASTLSVSPMMSSNPDSEHETVLIIDDEEIVRSLLNEYLTHERYSVLTAADGKEGVRVFQERRPSIVLTDVRMPGMDGMGVLRAIRREDPEAKVVVMTGHGDGALALEALRAGASNYIRKPLSLEELLFIVRAHERMLRANRRQRLPYETLVEERKILRLTNDRNAIYPAVCSVTQSLQGVLSSDEIESISLAVSEALINAIEHGNLRIGYDLKSEALRENRYHLLLEERLNDPELAAKRVTFESNLNQERILLKITDEGQGFDWRNLPDPSDPDNILREHGRGLSIIGLFMDQIGFNDCGNQVWMRRNIKRDSGNATPTNF